MPTRAKAAPKRKTGKPTARKAGPAKKSASGASSRKAVASSLSSASRASVVAATKAPPRPVPLASPAAAQTKAPQAMKPPPRPMSAGQVATAQQAEERRKAATRKLFARIRSLEAILGADLRKRGSLLLSQAVDQWYAEATSTTATDVSITNAARTVISQL
jgi:hypothetical protein